MLKPILFAVLLSILPLKLSQVRVMISQSTGGVLAP